MVEVQLGLPSRFYMFANKCFPIAQAIDTRLADRLELPHKLFQLSYRFRVAPSYFRSLVAILDHVANLRHLLLNHLVERVTGDLESETARNAFHLVQLEDCHHRVDNVRAEGWNVDPLHRCREVQAQLLVKRRARKLNLGVGLAYWRQPLLPPLL